MDLALLQAWLDSLWQGVLPLSHKSTRVQQVAKVSRERLGPESFFTPLKPLPALPCSPHGITWWVFIWKSGWKKLSRAEASPSSWKWGKARLWCQGNTSFTRRVSSWQISPIALVWFYFSHGIFATASNTAPDLRVTRLLRRPSHESLLTTQRYCHEVQGGEIIPPQLPVSLPVGIC